MEDYAGRLLADRYRLPRLPAEEFELAETRAFDTASGQEVLVHQVPLPEVVDAEVLDQGTAGAGASQAATGARGGFARATREPADPTVRRAVEAALAAARLPDHPRLDQVFDAFVEGDGLWIVSELVPARPLAVLLAERPLSPHRAAEVAADLLAALRVVHAHGWTHRNITTRTVLVCDDGRAVLTGLAVAAAEEALCGYDPLPPPESRTPGGPPPVSRDTPVSDTPAPPRPRGHLPAHPPGGYPPAQPAEAEQPRGGHGPYPDRDDGVETPARPREASFEGAAPARTVRGDAIAAYRAGARAGADAAGHQGRDEALPTPRPEPVPRAAPVPAARGATDDAPPTERYRGPTTALAAERARQARITMVGPVTERWAPEQAGPVHENWRLAPPVGPAADLWALGALLFRAVQGHPPYPEEEGAAELVHLVCAEPPAYAEDCGALRPVVESLLRQDPTERPDVEELRGWLRSLIRSAPEPEAGLRTITVPPALESTRPADPRRLPVVRRRGELVRRRHRRQRPPRALGRLLVGAVLLGMVAAIGLVMLLMPGASERPAAGGESGRPTAGPSGGGDASGRPSGSPSEEGAEDRTGASGRPSGAASGGQVPEGYTLRRDPAGFQLVVPRGWRRHAANGQGQVRYTSGDLELVVVAGRDGTGESGADPMTYQTEDEPELASYRSSAWASATGLREIVVGDRRMVQGEFTWRDDTGGRRFAHNQVMVVAGRYHVVLVQGPESQRKKISAHFRQAAESYQPNGD